MEVQFAGNIISTWLVVENNGHIMMVNTMVVIWLMMVNTNDWLVVDLPL